jgi:hypothetical protein
MRQPRPRSAVQFACLPANFVTVGCVVESLHPEEQVGGRIAVRGVAVKSVVPTENDRPFATTTCWRVGETCR